MSASTTRFCGLLTISLACGLVAFTAPTVEATEPVIPDQGLLLWLDAAATATLSIEGSDDCVLRWRSRTDPSVELTAQGSGCVRRIRNAVAGHDVLQFDGATCFRLPPLRTRTGECSVFVVSRRPVDLVGGDTWQRLISSAATGTKSDTDAPSFCLAAPERDRGQSVAYETIVSESQPQQVRIGNLAIGASSVHGGQKFRGQICELLIYDHNFNDELAINRIRSYLAEKWNASVKAHEQGWVRVGGLPSPPVRISDDLPLSDQANEGQWTPLTNVSDEFSGNRLDEQKWMPRSPYWLGRPPAFFVPSNVRVADGQLQLTFRKQEVPEMPKDKGFHTYTSAYVRSKTAVRYGYFEIRAKPMSSAASSSFWLSGRDENHWTEIDVFEVGAGATGFERKYNMHVHVFETPKEKRHWQQGGAWTTPWDLAADYHVYGLEWDASQIVWYVDGVAVGRMENTDWHNPLNVIVDTESMFNWFGEPDAADLPSTYHIDYIRSWRRKQPAKKVSMSEFLDTITASPAEVGTRKHDLRHLFEQTRQWTDRSGRHSITARVNAIKSGWVQLQLPDGTLKSVRLEKLSVADQNLLQRLQSASVTAAE